MSELVDRDRQSVEVRRVVDRARSVYSGVEVDVWSPTEEERAGTGAVSTYQEIVVGTSGPERYVIPLNEPGRYEVWRVGVDAPPGSGELIGHERELSDAVDAAVSSARTPSDRRQAARSWEPHLTVPSGVASWSTEVYSLASQVLHGGRSLNPLDGQADQDPAVQQTRDELRLALQELAHRLEGTPTTGRVTTAVNAARESLLDGDLDTTLRHLAVADQVHENDSLNVPEADATEPRSAQRDSSQQTAVSNAVRSDMTAVEQIQAQARVGVEADQAKRLPLRDEEAELLARFDQEEADLARSLGATSDLVHRRPERSVEHQPAARDHGRSVHGSD